MIDFVPLAVGAAIALFAIGVALESRARRRAIAGELATVAAPPALYPRINANACICSGACVPACPEGDVIALVDGRPRLIRPSACIGHADCLRSCPVSAIELVLGTAERGIEVPVVSSAFETTVPGLYVAGEVTGVALIHNAVAQGRQVAATALADLPAHRRDFDLIVVGAGPAGIGAALEARRRGARVVVYERGDRGGAIRSYPRQKIVMTAPLDLPGIGNVRLRRTSKEALLELFDSVIRRAALPILNHVEVTAIHAIAGGMRVETSAGVATAPRVILAIGRRGAPRRLGVPGDHLPHVVYDVPDPVRHAGQRIVVVGGGDSAAELALALAGQRTTHVTLVHRGSDFARCKPDNRRALARAHAAGRIAIRLATTLRAVELSHVELECADRATTVPASLVVCCLGAQLPSQWLRGVGVALRELRGEPLSTR